MPEVPKQALLAHGESLDNDVAQYVIFLGPDTRTGDDRDERIEGGRIRDLALERAGGRR